MFCPHCGAELPDGSAFCGYCGKPLPSRPKPASAPGTAHERTADAAPEQPAETEQPVEAEVERSVADAPEMPAEAGAEQPAADVPERPAEAEEPAADAPEQPADAGTPQTPADDAPEPAALDEGGASEEPEAAPGLAPEQTPQGAGASDEPQPEAPEPTASVPVQAAAPGSTSAPARPAQAPWADPNPPKQPFHVTRGMTIGVLIAAAAVVILIVLAVAGVLGGGGARNSAEGVATRVEGLYNDLIQSDFDEAAFSDFGNGLVDLLPPAVVDEALEQSGYTRDEFSERFGSAMGGAIGSYGSMLSSYLDMFDISVDITLGDRLDSARLQSINDGFASAGYDAVATDGYLLGGEVSVTFNEDFGEYGTGDSMTQDMGDTGLCAVEIDGNWYLWSGAY